MSEPERLLKSKSLTTPRAAAVAGVLFAILYGTSLVLIRLAIPADSTTDGGAWLETNARTAASNMESLLPDPGKAKRAAAILILRGREEVGSTFIGVLRRYAEALQANDGRLYLSGVGPQLFEQLRRTGLVSLLGPDRIMTYHRQFGTSANQALSDAYNWLGTPVQYASEEIIEESSE